MSSAENFEDVEIFVESELERKIDELKQHFDEDLVEEIVKTWKKSD